MADTNTAGSNTAGSNTAGSNTAGSSVVDASSVATTDLESDCAPTPTPFTPSIEDLEHCIGSALEDIDEALFLVRADGLIASCNVCGAKLLGRAREEVVGTRFTALFGEAAAELEAQIDDEVRRFGRVRRIEVSIAGRNGPLPVSLTKTPIHLPSGAPAGFSVVLHDLRARRQMERQLLRADRLATIGLLASSVAHEVGTPLNVILGRAELLEQTLEDNPLARRQLSTISAQIQRIADVVSRLLTFSREAGPGSEPVYLNRVIDEVIAFVEPRMKSHSITLCNELDADLPTLTGHPSHFYQVFLNLVMNAIDAMPSGGQLTVRTSHCQGATLVPGAGLDCRCIQAQVVDTGHGIASHDMKKIFEPFFTTKGRSKGTGLGLAIADEIIRKYSGQLQVQSHVDTGTQFTVSMPLGTIASQVVS